MDDLTPSMGGPTPDAPITEFDRQAMVYRIQSALAEDHLEFSEVDDRFGLVFAAQTREELAASVAGLPEPPQPPPPQDARHFASDHSFSVIGDIKIGGWLAVGKSLSATTLIGDVIVDVSSAAFDEDGLDITATVVIGDVKIVVPDGARVQSSVVNLIGGRKEILVAPAPGAPVVRIKAYGLIGDVAIYSLSAVPEGKLRRMWAALRRTVDG
jgi:hypothetical protein